MIHGVNRIGQVPPTGVGRTHLESVPGFGDTLDALLQPQRTRAAEPELGGAVRFSKHAEARMVSRGIELDESDLTDLGNAVDALSKKGAKESLILLGDNAFIVGVPDRKVITALSRSEAVGNIFTHIDSTVVAR
jgi:flagellar operon protein